MSVPDELYIGRNKDGYTEYFMPDRKTAALYDYMEWRMYDIVPENYADQFIGEFCGEVFSITDIPAEYYMAVYKLIMEACDNVEQLKPCKADLQKALQADPRYQAV